MNLKEAFRYKHCLSSWILSALCGLNGAAIYNVVEEHQKSAVVKTEHDQLIDISMDRTNGMDVNQTLAFVSIVQKEYNDLSMLIDETMAEKFSQYKATLDAVRLARTIAERTQFLVNKKNEDIRSAATGTVIGAAGASAYTYPVVTHKVLTYDPNELAAAIKQALDKADKTSDMIERQLVTIEVPFEPKFSVNDTVYSAAVTAGCVS